ncbi:MAG: prepilin-type N-terminal cleavage/methylation domain-containing protein, partial [Candidatus Moranbacteria bacterium]|nr:prepilin-type N-terminal cleavage/methylation domain-containing protein [Candidatus Moranbacteria bacterium]
MQKTKSKNQGFTLIETIVVIAIIAIILTVVGVSQSKNIKRKQTESIAYTIKQAIELTRDYALTGEVIDNKLPDIYQFRLDPSCQAPDCVILIGSSSKQDYKTIPLKEYDSSEMKIRD